MLDQTDRTTGTELPWLDRPDALELLYARQNQLSTPDFDRLLQWERDGFIVLEGAIPVEQIDAMMSELAGLWHAARPIAGLRISGAQVEPGKQKTVSHEELLAMPAQTRAEIERRSHWWVNDFGNFSAVAREIAANPEVSRVSDLVLGRHTEIEGSTNLWGTGDHPLHQDILHEPTFPLNTCIGVDVVCEDMHPDAGPALFYPGSHRTMWEGWTNYPETSLATCDATTMAGYRAWITQTVRDYPCRASLCRKGDVFLWHGSLVHCGTAPKDPRRSRKSFVLHSFPPGANITNQVKAARLRQGFGNLQP